MTNKCILGDCLEELPKIESDSIDLVITSPPYDNIENAGYGMKTKDILFLKLYSEFLDVFFTEIHRVMKPTGQFFFNIKSGTSKKTLITPHWIERLESFQKFKLKSYIIWKYSGSFDSTKSRFHLDYEIIYHLSKTDDITIYYNEGEHDPLTSVWQIPHNIPKSERVHPTQYPEALAERMIKRGSKEGDTVLDPFLGSGTSMVVATKLNRNCIGIEINPHNMSLAQKRVDEL